VELCLFKPDISFPFPSHKEEVKVRRLLDLSYLQSPLFFNLRGVEDERDPCLSIRWPAGGPAHPICLFAVQALSLDV
jgi:hypothetical protein